MEEELKKYEDYLLYEEKSSATIEKYLRDVRKYFCFAGKQVLQDSSEPISKELVMKYKKELANQYRPSSVNSMLAALNNYLSYKGRMDCHVKLLKIQKKGENTSFLWQMQLSIQNSLTVRIQIKISVAQWLQ